MTDLLPNTGDVVAYHPGWSYGRSDAPRPAVVVARGNSVVSLDLAVTPLDLAEPPELLSDVPPRGRLGEGGWETVDTLAD